jgi:hypothetical protein
VTQLSLFSADLAEPRPEDLGGLLAAHGQAARGAGGTRLSILLADEWRGRALLAECRVRDIPAELEPAPPEPGRTGPQDAGSASGRPGGVVASGQLDGVVASGRPGRVLLRTARLSELTAIADDWSRGAVKAVPPGLALGAGLLRCWVLAAGRPVALPGMGFLLGLDPHAPQTHEPLAAACSRAGTAGAIVGAAAGGPAVRVTGRRRLLRLAEILGSPPRGAPVGAFPVPPR